MKFHYREVAFGTSFDAQGGLRQSGGVQPQPHLLFANEIAVDVGGTCFGYRDEQRWIFDHHFTRPANDENFPCAAVAVIHGLPFIHEYFSRFEDVWIVTHSYPDFDAHSASYLVRKGIEGNIPLGDATPWMTVAVRFGSSWSAVEAQARPRKIDWYEPALLSLAENPDIRWPILLAAYASHVDNCRRIGCRKNQTVNAVLSAAIRRGRPLPDRAYDFFESVRAAIAMKGLNPLFDSLFEGDTEYLPELRMLEQQVAAYERDIRRARKFLVYLDVNSSIGDWFKQVEGPQASNAPSAFRMAEGSRNTVEVNPDALDGLVESRRIADGLFLADPECLLFKDWVREDNDNSQMGQGFLFTAIAYSNLPGVKTRYVLSLDPERAQGANLYRLWARLQADELTKLREQGRSGGTCRPRFEQRARGFEDLFDKRWLWFDGQNYAFTIVENGTEGTLLQSRSGKAPFTADGVGRIIRDELEYGFYHNTRHELSAAEVVDFPLSDGSEPKFNNEKCQLQTAKDTPLGKQCYRFAAIRLNDDVSLSQPGIGEQIGRALWPFLEDSDIDSVPADFSLRHLDARQESIIVWNRGGMAIAYRESNVLQKQEVMDQLQDLASVNMGIQGLLRCRSDFEQMLEEGKVLLRQILTIQLKAIEPNQRYLRLFLEMTQFERFAHAVHSLNAETGRAVSEKQNKEEAERDKRLEMIITILGAVFVIPSLMLSFLGVNIRGLTSGDEGLPLNAVILGVAASMSVGALLLWILTRGRCRDRGDIC